MTDSFYRLRSRIDFIIGSQSIYSAHSPFIYRLLKTIREVKKKDLELINSLITKISPGAKEGPTRLISSRQLRLLFALSQFRCPETILQLGSANPLTTIALWAGNKTANIYSDSIDLVTEVAKFDHSQMRSVNFYPYQTGQESLNALNKKFDVADLIHISAPLAQDALASLSYYIKTSPDEQTIIMLEGIHNSKKMNQTWRVLSSGMQVTLSIDFFDSGVMFFNRRLSKQHIQMRY